MSDFNYGGTDEESAEIKKLDAEVVCHSDLKAVHIRSLTLLLQLEDPDNFEHWEKLVRAAESLEGGLNRNSSPQAIATTRSAYDRFLAKFPLLFGYWKKYADLEFSIAGTEAAEMVFERGVASITTSVDLWTDYTAFKIEVSQPYPSNSHHFHISRANLLQTSHDPDIIRE